MASVSRRTPDPSRPADQVQAFIEKFAPAHRRLIRAVRAALRKRLPSAHELVYDNYNFFVIGYSPTLRPSDAVISIVAGASGISLCFIQGAHLPDPDKILLGAGRQTRFVRLPTVDVLASRPLKALLDAAVADSDVPFARGRGSLVVRVVAARQRPRQARET